MIRQILYYLAVASMFFILCAEATLSSPRDSVFIRVQPVCSEGIVCYTFKQEMTGLWCTDKNETVTRYCGG